MARNRRIRRGPATSNRVTAWLLHHLQSLVFSLGKIYQAPATTIMTVAVIGITLSLPGGFYLLLKNVTAMAGDLRSSTQISLYLDLGTSEARARELGGEIAALAEVESTRFIPRDEALEQFRENSGFGKSIDTLSSNPLPHTLLVQPVDGDRFMLRNLVNRLEAMPEVEIARRGVVLITALFACAVLLIIGNTIRLDIQNRYQEIIVTKLIGATDAFIRRPFLYGGVWYGLFGGILSWLIVEIGYLAISGPLQRLNLLYDSQLALTTFSLQDFAILLSSSTVLGLAGSWIAVARHLSQIEPS